MLETIPKIKKFESFFVSCFKIFYDLFLHDPMEDYVIHGMIRKNEMLYEMFTIVKIHMQIFLAFFILLGFVSFVYADEFRPLPEDFRKNSEFVVDFSPLYDVKEVSTITLSPLKQSKMGVIAEDVQCRSKLHLIIKHDETPACVKSQTAVKLIDKTSRDGWVPSNHLFQKLEEQIYSISNPTSCPRWCVSLEPVDTMEGANSKTEIDVDLPDYIQQGYEFFRFFSDESYLGVQISPEPITENTIWSKFYLIYNGIFMIYHNNPVTVDGKTQVAYWAKSSNVQNISPTGNDPIYVRDRGVTYDEDLDLLFLGYPSEVQFSMDDNISVAVMGFVSRDKIISIANSILNHD